MRSTILHYWSHPIINMDINSFLSRLTEYHDRKFWLGDVSYYSYHDLIELVEKYRALIRGNKIRPKSFIPVIGDFSISGFAILLALAAEGVFFAPLTQQSYQKLLPQILSLGPANIITLEPISNLKIVSYEYANSTIEKLDLLPDGQSGLIVFTSGSTGTPKAILHNFDNLLSKFETPRYPHRAIPFLLYDHLGGVNTLLSLASSGGSLVQIGSRGISDICRAIEKFRVTLLPTTPTFLNLLLASGEIKKTDFSSLRLVTYGTEVMTESILKKLVTALPSVEYKQTYGLSELGVFQTSSLSKDSSWITIGGKGVETKVIDNVLWVKSHSKMLGHFEFRADGNLWAPQTDDWFCTNDLVEQNGDYLKILGRQNDLINVSGLKVYPTEIENCLLACPLIAQATVIGESNALTGQIIVAQVMLTHGADTRLARREIDKFCRERLDRYKVPSKYIFVEELLVSDRYKTVRKSKDA